MANIVITDVDTGQIALEGEEFSDEVIAFAGADDLLAGTILARDSVSLKLVIYVKGGVTNENGIPKAMLTYPVTSTGAGDVAVRALIKGTVNADRLVIDADADASNVDGAVLDELRTVGLTPVSVSQQGRYDNPNNP